MADILQDQLAEIPAKQPPKKRSLFNRPVPKPVTAVTEEDEAVDFFRRSREVFPQHLNEQRRRREKKAAKTERKRSSASIEKTETTSSQEKRRRLSSQGAHSSDEDTSRRRKESTQPTTPSRVSQRGLNTASDASPKTLSGRYSRELRAKPEGTPAKVPEITTLSDTESDKDEEPILITGKPAQTFTIDDDSDYTAKSIALSDDDQSSEDEYSELLQQAKERARQKLVEQNAAKDLEQRNHMPSSNDMIDDDLFQMDEPKKDADPVLEILVTSHIDGSKPVIAKRKLKSRLQEVRKTWCDKQVLHGQPMFPSAESKNCVFLTYKGKRLYDLTTCDSLGLTIDTEGRLVNNDQGEMKGRVHLFAWTPNLFEEYQRNEARKRRGLEEEENSQEVEEKRIRIILKSKNHGQHKLMARAAITFDQIAAAFRKEKAISNDEEVTLQYDGETLDPEMIIGDSEIEDLDVIEVHIK